MAREFESETLGNFTQQHICVVTETYSPEINGVAITLSRLVSGLRARGNRVSVVHPRQRNDMLNGEFDDIRVRGLPLPGYHGLQFGVPAGRLLKEAWNHHRPEVVYVATEGPLGWSAVRAAQGMGIPAVSGFHTNFHSYCKHYGIGWLQHVALRYLRWFHNQTERTLVSNEELRDQLKDVGFLNVGIIERGVDSQLFTPERRCTELRREWGLSKDDLALIYVGRIAPEKNLAMAVEAYRAIKRFNSRIKFVLVGDGPQRQSLQRENPDLIFTGMRMGEELGKHYASADVFLFPSETETFGNVTLEAMASGLAVVAYNYACAKLHITNGETGVLVKFGDAKSFVGSACALVREPRDILRIGRLGRQYASYLGWDRVVERFESLLLNTGRQGRGAAASPLRRRLAT
ncbi:glycosyltransferase family 4 protein [Candidatus Binatus sp.]|uniref:glycosyltransferase family 4 protein n=2 Tax=Candidatus Binatus sp. TaxID=2811406 RepID=UPI003C6F6A39